MPTPPYTSAARRNVSGSVRSPPQISTSGSRYTGLNGCPTQKRSGRGMSAWSRVGSSPEVDDAMIASAGAARARARQQLALHLLALGRALLHEIDAVDGLLERRDQGDRRPRAAAVRTSGGVYARRALASTSPTLRSASGSGSYSRTSIPFSAKRAAQPPPITPPPSSPTVREAVIQTCFVSARRSRTSAGPRTRTFIASRIATARATSSPFDASTPRDR